jgi:hypothetical protein
MSVSTFGYTLTVDGTAVLGLTSVTSPRLNHTGLLDKLTHGSSGGITEKVHPKTYAWTPGSATYDVIVADAGQVKIASAAAGDAVKTCVFTKPGVAAITVSCFISVAESDNAANTPGVQSLTATFEPTGAAS